jgi:hypothetical protein
MIVNLREYLSSFTMELFPTFVGILMNLTIAILNESYISKHQDNFVIVVPSGRVTGTLES